MNLKPLIFPYTILFLQLPGVPEQNSAFYDPLCTLQMTKVTLPALFVNNSLVATRCNPKQISITAAENVKRPAARRLIAQVYNNNKKVYPRRGNNSKFNIPPDN